jgi:hypothetical protein
MGLILRFFYTPSPQLDRGLSPEAWTLLRDGFAPDSFLQRGVLCEPDLRGRQLSARRQPFPHGGRRPIIKWPDNARVAFWVAPNMEFFEYLPENRPTQPDIPHYSRMDYGNRVGFSRMRCRRET